MPDYEVRADPNGEFPQAPTDQPFHRLTIELWRDSAVWQVFAAQLSQEDIAAHDVEAADWRFWRALARWVAEGLEDWVRNGADLQLSEGANLPFVLDVSEIRRLQLSGAPLPELFSAAIVGKFRVQ